MGIDEALSFIHATSWMGSRLGLTRMRDIMQRLGNPQDGMRFIHVAGTNGKGSACAMLASVLTAAGYRTGMYTSPHLVRVNERMQIDGGEISNADLADTALQVKMVVDAMAEKPTEFEIITAIALLYFRKKPCDVVVLEVGLGGRTDATNIISTPVLAVIMNIGLEHTEVLGDTLEKIAAEEAGIIKPGVVVVTYRATAMIESVYERICAERNATLCKTRFDGITVRETGLDGQSFDWKQHQNIALALPGRHQVYNAVTVLNAVDQLRTAGWEIDEAAVQNGLFSTRWPARFEVLCRYPLFILDGAHNPQCMETLAENIKTLIPEGGITFLTGMLADKDYDSMIDTIKPFAKQIVCLTPDSERALPAAQLAECAKEKGLKAETAKGSDAGIDAALEIADGGPIVAMGSLYLVGSIREQACRKIKQWQRKKGVSFRESLSLGVC